MKHQVCYTQFWAEYISLYLYILEARSVCVGLKKPGRYVYIPVNVTCVFCKQNDRYKQDLILFELNFSDKTNSRTRWLIYQEHRATNDINFRITKSHFGDNKNV